MGVELAGGWGAEEARRRPRGGGGGGGRGGRETSGRGVGGWGGGVEKNKTRHVQRVLFFGLLLEKVGLPW